VSPGPGDPCPCGGGTFGTCCGPVLDGSRPAATAVALMRSRYTAFAVGDVAYLLRSWHRSTRPPTLELDDDLVWRRLVVLGVEAGGPWDDEGVVEFVAQYTSGLARGRLHERSRFVRVDGWQYVDGIAPAE